jgi:mRNA interferase MazF
MTTVPSPLAPLRGEVWVLSFDPTRGHEQAGTWPALVISVDVFNAGPADLAIVLPITSRAKGVRSHVPIEPPEGGLTVESFIKCEDVRSVSKDRLQRRLGTVSADTIAEVEARLRILLGL